MHHASHMHSSAAVLGRYPGATTYTADTYVSHPMEPVRVCMSSHHHRNAGLDVILLTSDSAGAPTRGWRSSMQCCTSAPHSQNSYHLHRRSRRGNSHRNQHRTCWTTLVEQHGRESQPEGGYRKVAQRHTATGSHRTRAAHTFAAIFTTPWARRQVRYD